MKGVVFTEFLEMVEEKFSLAMLDHIIAEAAPANGGAYTVVGTYDHREMVQLVASLSAATRTPVSDLLRAFGEHLFKRFAVAYPEFFRAAAGAFHFLLGIENRIHSEVRKLYPGAELPSFSCAAPDAQTLIMEYESVRALGDLAEGLIRGCIAHFNEPIALRREDLAGAPGARVRFVLVRQIGQ